MANRLRPLTAPATVYQRRRATLAAAIRRPIVIPAGKARSRNYPANIYPFRPGSTYLYFGGLPFEGAAWLIEPGSDGIAGCTLFRPAYTLDDAVWMGELPADDEIASAAGVPVGSLHEPDQLGAKVKGRGAVFIRTPCPETTRWMAELGVTPAEAAELKPIIDMRLHKDSFELDAMRFAAGAAVRAHRAAMAVTRPERSEAEVLAAFRAVLVEAECDESFTTHASIQGEVLHSSGRHQLMRDGRLLLVDGGAEEPGGYASDITRTFPVSGTFTGIQRALYDTVLAAQEAAIEACTPGTRFRDIHDLAAMKICEGLVEADLLRGKPEDLAKRYAHTLFFTHGLGHLVGLDVHDMEDYGEDLVAYPPGRTRRTEFGNKYLRLDRDLEPGMVVTIEPGLYLVPAIWRNADMVGRFADAVNRARIQELLDASFGGIRIEDTVLVRDTTYPGPEVLTGALPKDADTVEQLVGTAGCCGAGPCS